MSLALDPFIRHVNNEEYKDALLVLPPIDTPCIIFNRAICNRQLGYFSLASELYQRAYDMEPKLTVALFGCGTCESLNKDFEGAIVNFTLCLEAEEWKGRDLIDFSEYGLAYILTKSQILFNRAMSFCGLNLYHRARDDLENALIYPSVSASACKEIAKAIKWVNAELKVAPVHWLSFPDYLPSSLEDMTGLACKYPHESSAPKKKQTHSGLNPMPKPKRAPTVSILTHEIPSQKIQYFGPGQSGNEKPIHRPFSKKKSFTVSNEAPRLTKKERKSLRLDLNDVEVIENVKKPKTSRLRASTHFSKADNSERSSKKIHIEKKRPKVVLKKLPSSSQLVSKKEDTQNDIVPDSLHNLGTSRDGKNTLDKHKLLNLLAKNEAECNMYSKKEEPLPLIIESLRAGFRLELKFNKL